MKNGVTEKYLTAARIVVMLLAVVAGAQAFLPGTGPTAPLSPGEAKTLLFAHNYFTITFLKSVYDNSMPLYYIAAHFIAFLPREILMLRLFSFICFLGTLHAAYSLFRESATGAGNRNSLPPATNAGLLFLGLAPLFVYFSWRAEPFTPAAYLLTLASLNFYNAYVTRSADSKLYIKWMLLSIYTTHYSVFFLLSHFLSLRSIRKYSGARISSSGTGDFRRVMTVSLPAFLLFVLGSMKPGSFLNDIYSLVAIESNTYGIVGNEFFWNDLFSSYLGKGISLFIAVLIPLWLLSLCRRRPPGAAGGKTNPFSVPVTVLISCACCWFFRPVMDGYSSENLQALSVFKGAYAEAGQSDAFLLEDRFHGDVGRLFEYYFMNSGITYMVASPGSLGAGELALGRDFPPSGKPAGPSPELLKMKELFFDNDTVWLFRGSLNATRSTVADGVLYNSFYAWAENSVEVVGSVAFNKASFPEVYFIAEETRLNPRIPAETILLEMFFNDYNDLESAARLLQDKDFTPYMMGEFLELDGSEHIWERVLQLTSACGGNNRCRTATMEKVLRYATDENAGAGGQALLQAVLDTYRKVLGGGKHKPNLKFD